MKHSPNRNIRRSIGRVSSLSESSLRRVWPIFVITTLTLSRQSSAATPELNLVLRQLGADTQTLRRLRAAVLKQQNRASLTWIRTRRRARLTGAVPEFRFRYSRGWDDGQRSSVSIEDSSLGNDIDSTASQGTEQRFVGELRWQPASLVFHTSEVRTTQRQQDLKSEQLKIRLRIARVFMARRAAILSWVRAQTSDEKNKYWNIVLERGAELDELTAGHFGRLIRRKQN